MNAVSRGSGCADSPDPNRQNREICHGNRAGFTGNRIHYNDPAGLDVKRDGDTFEIGIVIGQYRKGIGCGARYRTGTIGKGIHE
ncbi:MAG: hypothetical protein K8F59_10935 [Rhodobacteraceae bacterium]|nr:hypothetical protein [Paracoccaceae bacterium]